MRRGDLLLRFADTALGGSTDDLERVRDEVVRELGPEALGDAAAVVAIFCCNVRVADATGIPLDAINADRRKQAAEVIGIHRFDATGATTP